MGKKRRERSRVKATTSNNINNKKLKVTLKSTNVRKKRAEASTLVNSSIMWETIISECDISLLKSRRSKTASSTEKEGRGTNHNTRNKEEEYGKSPSTRSSFWGTLPSVCNICGKDCRDSLILIQHIIRIHSIEKNIQCDLCNKFYSNIHKLKQHKKRVHPNVNSKPKQEVELNLTNNCTVEPIQHTKKPKRSRNHKHAKRTKDVTEVEQVPEGNNVPQAKEDIVLSQRLKEENCLKGDLQTVNHKKRRQIKRKAKNHTVACMEVSTRNCPNSVGETINELPGINPKKGKLSRNFKVPNAARSVGRRRRSTINNRCASVETEQNADMTVLQAPCKSTSQIEKNCAIYTNNSVINVNEYHSHTVVCRHDIQINSEEKTQVSRVKHTRKRSEKKMFSIHCNVQTKSGSISKTRKSMIENQQETNILVVPRRGYKQSLKTPRVSGECFKDNEEGYKETMSIELEKKQMETYCTIDKSFSNGVIVNNTKTEMSSGIQTVIVTKRKRGRPRLTDILQNQKISSKEIVLNNPEVNSQRKGLRKQEELIQERRITRYISTQTRKRTRTTVWKHCRAPKIKAVEGLSTERGQQSKEFLGENKILTVAIPRLEDVPDLELSKLMKRRYERNMMLKVRRLRNKLREIKSKSHPIPLTDVPLEKGTKTQYMTPVLEKSSEKCMNEGEEDTTTDMVKNIFSTTYTLTSSNLLSKNEEELEPGLQRKLMSPEPNSSVNYDNEAIKKIPRRFDKRHATIDINIRLLKKFKTGQNKYAQYIEEERSSTANMEEVFNHSIDDQEVAVTLSSKGITCSKSNKGFDTERSLIKHMICFHNETVQDAIDSKLIPSNRNSPQEGRETPKYEMYHTDLERFTPFPQIARSEASGEDTRKVVGEMSSSFLEDHDNTKKRNKKWRCKLCKENFALIRNYLRHKYYVHNDETVVHICENCKKVLTSVAMVNIHVCTNVSFWDCRRCNIKFVNALSLTQHNMNCHLESVGPHICEVCGSTFLTVYMLERHQSMLHFRDSINSVKPLPMHPISESTNKSLSCNNKNAEAQALCVANTQNSDRMREIKTSTNYDLHDKDRTLPDAQTSLNTTYISGKGEDQCKCKLCNLICLTRERMKNHLWEEHSIKVDVCKLCTDLYISGAVGKHLIIRHVFPGNLNFGNVIQKCPEQNGVVDNQADLVKMLGIRRLLSVYEYLKFDSAPENESIQCTICSEELLDSSHYKVHYSKTHDILCVLCNIEFECNYHAVEHKVTTHSSIDSYIWAVQKIKEAILKTKRYGTTNADVLSKLREMQMRENLRCAAQNTKTEITTSFKSKSSNKSVALQSLDDVIQGFENMKLFGATKYEEILELTETGNICLTSIDTKYQGQIKSVELSVDSGQNELQYISESFSISGQSSSQGSNQCVLIITEEALKEHRDDITNLVSNLYFSNKLFPQGYVANLLTEYTEQAD